jgi:hypothetical protein
VVNEPLSELVIRLRVPLLTQEGFIGAPALVFHRWLPIEEDQSICVTQGRLTLRLWFDLECTRWVEPVKEEDLGRTENVLAHYVWADVTVRDVDDELPAHMTRVAREGFTHEVAREENALAERKDKIVEEAYLLVLHTLNRLVSYARSSKGQFWLDEYRINTGQVVNLFSSAKVCSDGGEWFPLHPTNPQRISVKTTSSDRYIRAEEWDDVRKFVLARPWLVRCWSMPRHWRRAGTAVQP